MILKASHHPVIQPFFRAYTLCSIRLNFHEVMIQGEYRDQDLPILLICNHISWWDGFWAEYLNLKVFHRNFHFMMLEEQLKRHMFLNKIGGYSVKRGSRSIIESLDYTAELLKDKRNLVLMFPQGGIESLHNQKITFERGVEYVLRKSNGKIQIMFLVNLIEYFEEQKPGLLMYFREYIGREADTETLQLEYNEFYSECVASNIRKSKSL